MSNIQKFENRLHDLYLSDKEFIHKILDNELKKTSQIKDM